MSTGIAECRGIDAAGERNCGETRETTSAAEPCTVTTDVCRLTTGDVAIKTQDPEKEAAIEDCCCCDS